MSDDGCIILLIWIFIVFMSGYLFGANFEEPDSIMKKDKLCYVIDSKIFCEVE